MGLRTLFGKIIKTPYYDVPRCPDCQSRITGRYLKAHSNNDNDYMITSSLKHGEIVKLFPENPVKNCFCLNCGNEWAEDIRVTMKSLSEIEKEKQARHTGELLSEYMSGKEDEGEKPFKTIRGFIGKI